VVKFGAIVPTVKAITPIPLQKLIYIDHKGLGSKTGRGERGEGRRSQSICTEFSDQFKCSTTEKTNNKPPEFVLG
jgi:hypothetical protein